jgi:hypothetical protein
MGAGLALAQGAEIERRTGMRELPILMNGQMVRSVLEGRKTQTRRPMKARRGLEIHGPCDDGKFYMVPEGTMGDVEPNCTPVEIKSPFGAPGDVLYVRENWKRSTPDLPDGVIYQADNLLVYDLPSNAVRFLQGNEIPRDGKWRPSIHMPRELSRTDLLVKRVWVEKDENEWVWACEFEVIQPETKGDREEE